MAGQPLEIAGAHKRTEKGNNDWYYGGGDVAWSDLATALAGVPVSIRPGKTIGVLENGNVIEYIWPANNTDDLAITRKSVLYWFMNSDYAKIYFESTGDADGSSQQIFETGDNGNDTVQSGATEGWIFRKTDGVLGAYEIMRINRTQLKWMGNDITLNKKVASYADMIALGTPKAMMQVRVTADENKGDTNTLYQLWPDGTRIWMAATIDN